MKLLLSPPYFNPVPLNGLDLETELRPLWREYGIELVDDPAEADLELAGQLTAREPERMRLPKHRVAILDGEPPQPEYLLPHYHDVGYAAVYCPANLTAYASDGMAYHAPPLPERPAVVDKPLRVIQLATFRTKPGNANFGQFMVASPNGQGVFAYRLLCVLRAQAGLALRAGYPDAIDIHGHGWPQGVALENSRALAQFLDRRDALCAPYAYDLCWENMEIPHYVSEKFWSPVRMGVLPIYWGAPDFHDKLPSDTIIDARKYLSGTEYDVVQLAYDLVHMDMSEYRRRVSRLLDWYYDLPHDAGHRSALAGARRLGALISKL